MHIEGKCVSLHNWAPNIWKHQGQQKIRSLKSSLRSDAVVKICRSLRVSESKKFLHFSRVIVKKILAVCHLSCPLSLIFLLNTQIVNSTFSNLYWLFNKSFYTQFQISLKVQFHLNACLFVTASDCRYLWFNVRVYGSHTLYGLRL